jgi:DNA invertase Pin-like site-specific DNA recombinase
MSYSRLRWSRRHLLETMTVPHERGIGFRSLTAPIDAISSGGNLIFHVFGALAGFERDLTGERAPAGLQAARVRGRYGDRPGGWT